MNILERKAHHLAECAAHYLKGVSGRLRPRRVTVKFLTAFAVFFAFGLTSSFTGSVRTAAAQNFADVSKSVSEVKEEPAKDNDDKETMNALMEVSNIKSGEEDNGKSYTLGATDIIEVTVLRHPEVTGEYEITQEGKIQYEFVGDIKVASLTKEEATKVIAKKLSDYIINPEVTVKITGYNSKVVYVVGEVFRPGKIFMRGDTITVREALMQAGLPMLTGVTKKSRLITPSDKGDAEKKEINVYALLYEGDLRENDIMHPGDVLYIPPTFLTKTLRAIQPVATPIGTAAGTGRTVMTGF